MSDHPFQVLDRCQIRWGRVLKVVDGVATVSATRLAWDGRTLCLGPPEVEMATVKADGRGFVPDLVPGEWVSLHWDWVCDRLTHIEVHSLRRYTIRHLGMANANWRRPAPL